MSKLCFGRIKYLSAMMLVEHPFCLFALLPQAHLLDPTKHYLRLKFLIENQVQFYIPKPEEDVCDLVCDSLERDPVPPPLLGC